MSSDQCTRGGQFHHPVRELPLMPSATNYDSSLVQQTQILCKSSGNSKATQKFNCVRTKHQKDQSKQNTLPDFDSYTIRTKSQVDSRMDLHRRSQFIFYLQLERELLILDEQMT